jgi:anti-anti-sigma regulatory factor
VEAGRSLTAGVVSDLGATISEQIARGVTAIHMDASRVVEFDSASLEALLDFDAKAGSRGVTFVLTDPSEVLATALNITGLGRQLEIAEATEVADAPEAIDVADPIDAAGTVEAIDPVETPARIEIIDLPEAVDRVEVIDRIDGVDE